MLIARIATSVHQRPCLCTTSARHLSSVLRAVQSHGTLVAAADAPRVAERRPTIISSPLYSAATYEVRTLLDALKLCSRALWLGANLLPPLLMLLPALLLPERRGLALPE